MDRYSGPKIPNINFYIYTLSGKEDYPFNDFSFTVQSNKPSLMKKNSFGAVF